jgi:transcriptional regulator GlxA family with amidase domain
VIKKARGLKVGFPLYKNLDSLDVLGPLQTFFYAGFDNWLLAEDDCEVESLEGVFIKPRAVFKAAPQLDILFVPGGSDFTSVLEEGPRGKNTYLDFLTQQAQKAKLVCSVCTGALLLAAGGLLDGQTVTTHWAFKDVLRLFPCTVVEDYRRYVRSGNRITGAGISSGLDEALYIVSVLEGVAVARRGQLSMQYHPQPLLHYGDPADADRSDEPGLPDQIRSDWQVAATLQQFQKWIAAV